MARVAFFFTSKCQKTNILYQSPQKPRKTLGHLPLRPHLPGWASELHDQTVYQTGGEQVVLHFRYVAQFQNEDCSSATGVNLG